MAVCKPGAEKSSGIDCPVRMIHEEELQVMVVTAVNNAWVKKMLSSPILRRTSVQRLAMARTAGLRRSIEQSAIDRQSCSKPEGIKARLTASPMRLCSSVKNGKIF